MVGPSGAGRARERVVVIDASHAARMKRAGWRHVLRTVASPRQVASIYLGLLAFILVLERDDPGGALVHLAYALVTALPATALVWGAMVVVVSARLGGWVDREAVPGRMLGVTVGPHSLRIRDHDTSVEMSYSAVDRVVQLGDIVIVRHSPAMWMLPVEVFDPVDLGVLQARAGKVTAPHELVG
ncbi:MAG TPA: hypothetical protein VGN19_05605 [Pedococcus sp.]|nr:hypothetical protein [Pedococcus sp.]